MIDFAAAGQDFQAYRAEPSGPARGAVLVVHEIWGLVPHIKDVADRLAAEGYLAVAPDVMALAGLDAVLMAELGERRSDPASRDDAQPKIRAAMAPLNSPDGAARVMAGLSAVFDYLDDSPEGAGRTSAVGFCFGGTYAFALAVAEPRLAGAIPFYGHADYPVAELAAITCPILAFYGADDTRLMEVLPVLSERMAEAGVDFRATVFPDAGHAFFNDSNPAMYRPDAARASWQQVLDFLADRPAAH